MSTLFNIGFAAPHVLWALAALPVIWWLLRATPPRPREISFPPMRLLLELMKREETPARTPWWLVLLRLALAALVIVAMARPVWQPAVADGPRTGPLVLVVDNGWAAARDWAERTRIAERLIEEAGDEDRPVVLVATAEGAAQAFSPRSAAEAASALAALEARPWASRPAAVAGPLGEMAAERGPVELVWLSDGLAADGSDAMLALVNEAVAEGAAAIYLDSERPVLAIRAVDNTARAMDVAVMRARASAVAAAPGAGEPAATVVRAYDRKGFVLAEAPLAFEPGAREAVVSLDLPTQMRNDVARVDLPAERSAAAVQLIDERWRRRTVGLITGTSADLAQPLLSPLHYLTGALEPFVDLRIPADRELGKAVDQLVDGGISVIVLADVGTMLDTPRRTLSEWVSNGGVLLRFAGPRTADGVDELVPVRMRSGVRTLGGNLSWDEPQPLAPIDEASPLAGIAVPEDVLVRRQLLAEPDTSLPERTWAQLADGTPLVTGRAHGKGWLVFFHVTADTGWSSLPLSGAFVEMLRKIVALSESAPVAGASASGEGALPPYRVLDGAGRLTAPSGAVEPLPVARLDEIEAGPTHPPGLYGSEDGFRALNLMRADDRLEPLDLAAADARIDVRSYVEEGPLPLKQWALAVAALLLLADGVAILLLMGVFRRRVTMPASIVLAAFALAALHPAPGLAQVETAPDLEFAMAAANETRLAYVSTGDAELDDTSHSGLAGLSHFLTMRTAMEPAEPVAVNLETDELAFFPLIYWPLSGSTERPSDVAMARVDAFMKNGGTILFDTRDQIEAGTSQRLDGATPATMRLRAILDGLDIPPLEPVPADHVLTKAFYLLQEFPGRWSGSPLWVEALSSDTARSDRPARSGDGVTPIMITANDLAGAWAMSEDGSFLYPTVPSDPFQRELAIRAGINIAVYTMTGNYKADQVHVPALLERLGQ